MAYKTKGNTHRMPDGTVMSGKKHSKSSKVVKKGSKAMKAKMARLRAMKKK